MFGSASAEEVTTTPFKLPIIKVVDGDTIETTLKGLPPPLNKFKVRVAGVDTPEKDGRAQCPEEAYLANQATAFTKYFVGNAKFMTVSSCHHDKYGGRIVCYVEVGKKDLSTELIKAGVAREYYGDKKKSWCE